jgi:hypothetical protein
MCVTTAEGGHACALTCEEGYGDCNASATDGCEARLDTVEQCGACGRDCRACGATGEVSCRSGRCAAALLTTRPNDLGLLAVDDTRIVTADANRVTEIGKTDFVGTSVYEAAATGLALRDKIFFIVPGTDSGTGIYRSSAGLVGPQIAAYARGQNVLAMAIDDTGVYYAVEKSFQATKIVRECSTCAVGTELSGNENEVRTNGIALDATTVFFGTGDMVRRVEKIGNDARTLALGQSPRALAVDATHVYWINEPLPVASGTDAGARGQVARAPKGGGAVEILADGLVQPTFLSLRGSTLYIVDAGRGDILRMGTDGRNKLTLAGGISSLGGIDVDASCVYFGAGRDLLRVTR